LKWLFWPSRNDCAIREAIVEKLKKTKFLD
jgi:hypothetical protein